MLYRASGMFPPGEITLLSDESAVVGVYLAGQKYFMDAANNLPVTEGENEALRGGMRWLENYFGGKKPSPDALTLAPRGSEFRRLIWSILLEIGYGEVRTYGEIADEAAKRLGLERMSARAVGGAVAHNPISIIIPCHRVVGADGGLTGYAGGEDKKLWLLRHEGVELTETAKGIKCLLSE